MVEGGLKLYLEYKCPLISSLYRDLRSRIERVLNRWQGGQIGPYFGT
jgi:hypothetical protein